MNFCVLIPLILGVLSAIFGYLLGRLFNSNKKCKNCDAYNSKVKDLESALKACKENQSAPKNGPSFNAALAKSVFGQSIKENSLTVVKGIGPKIQSLFYKNNIRSWSALAICNIERCQEILDAGGSSFSMHDPATWPEQARLAAEGKWKELHDWQNHLIRK